MRVAVVDDEYGEQEKLAGYLHDFGEETGIKLDVEVFGSGEELLSQYRKIFDIIIFDVDMPGINGMDTARKIRESDHHVIILFVTNIAQYAINGYEVDAVDYIIKPVGYYDFMMKFRKAVAKAAQRKDNGIYLDTTDGGRQLLIGSITYVEVIRHYLIYHARDGQYTVRGSMKDHERELTAYNFCRIHKSYLVNLAAVEEICPADVLVNGERLPVGRAYKNQLMQEYMIYVRGQ